MSHSDLQRRRHEKWDDKGAWSSDAKRTLLPRSSWQPPAKVKMLQKHDPWHSKHWQDGYDDSTHWGPHPFGTRQPPPPPQDAPAPTPLVCAPTMTPASSFSRASTLMALRLKMARKTGGGVLIDASLRGGCWRWWRWKQRQGLGLQPLMSNGAKATWLVREISPPPPRGGRWPTRRTSTPARVGGTKSLQETPAEEGEAIADRIVPEVLALGFANGEGLSKKVMKTRMLYVSGGARSSTLKKWESARAWFQRSRASRGWPASRSSGWRAFRRNLSDDLLIRLQLHGEAGTSSRRVALLVQ